MIYITEYATLAMDGSGHRIAAGQEPAVAEKTVPVSGASAKSAAFADTTRFVMVHAAVAACLKFGADPTALTSSHRIGAGETRFYGVVPGHKLAAIGAP